MGVPIIRILLLLFLSLKFDGEWSVTFSKLTSETQSWGRKGLTDDVWKMRYLDVKSMTRLFYAVKHSVKSIKFPLYIFVCERMCKRIARVFRVAFLLPGLHARSSCVAALPAHASAQWCTAGVATCATSRMVAWSHGHGRVYAFDAPCMQESYGRAHTEEDLRTCIYALLGHASMFHASMSAYTEMPLKRAVWHCAALHVHCVCFATCGCGWTYRDVCTGFDVHGWKCKVYCDPKCVQAMGKCFANALQDVVKVINTLPNYHMQNCTLVLLRTQYYT
jgi:hypothetical protein